VSSHSTRKLKTILANPEHPHHAAAKSELDRRSMQQEKTLTPAEKKKREEIAKAMERENPGMDKSKKMAIATATAKRVAEATLDEVLDTPKAMDRYKAKAKYSKDRAANSAAAKILRGPDADGNRADHSPELKTMAKRDKGLKMADKSAMRKTFKALRTAKNTHGK
jgi:hypothetical protein